MDETPAARVTAYLAARPWSMGDRDRLAANRPQVDRLAVWIEPPSFAPLQRTPGQPVWVDVRVLIRNTSKLPLEI